MNGQRGYIKFENGSLIAVFKGDVFDIQEYEHWIYFTERGISYKFCRYDTNNGRIDVIKEVNNGESSYVICPIGLLWVDKELVGAKYVQQIKHADYDGKNETIIYETTDSQEGSLGGLYIYHDSIYFKSYRKFGITLCFNNRV